MKIIEVLTKRQFAQFCNAGFQLLGCYPHYIAPLQMNFKEILDTRKNPLWKIAERKLFLAVDDRNRTLGCIAAIYHPEYIHTPQTGFIGYFHCENNIVTCTDLLQHAKDFLKTKQCNKVIGPFQPTLNYELGILVEGFEQYPYFMMLYNPPYYAQLLEQLGTSVMRFNAYQLAQGHHEEPLRRITELIKVKTSAYIKDIDFGDYTAEALALCAIYNSAFSTHFGFVPFSEKEFLFMANSLKPILIKQLLFKVQIEDNAVGFILAIPNMNEIIKTFRDGRLNLFRLLKLVVKTPKLKDVKIMIAAIAKPYQHLGLGSLLYMEMGKRTKALGIQNTEISWVAAENIQMNKLVHKLGATVSKTYSIYEFEMP